MTSLQPTILLVDDSPVNIELLKDALSRYNLLTANSGQDALALAFSRNTIDLILLDVIMPDMDGYSVCKLLKSNELTKDIPVIFITGQTDPSNVVKGFEVGGIDYIAKPFNMIELKARVNNHLAIKFGRDQNDRLMRKIEGINKKLTQNISYAKKIQEASLPKPSFMNRVLPEHFVMLKPRDVVSGDFYWVEQVDSKVVVVTADCTGHGVPGAIMSLFGVSYLNDIVGKKGETRPATILNKLREVVIESLQQDEHSEIKDGMDICIITIDASSSTIEYAGAFCPLFMLRNSNLTIYQSDHMPVSYGEIQKDFVNHEIHYEPNDCFYLFSDGFASQFGGSRDKKLMQKGFRKLIVENHLRPMEKQKQVFESFFDKWKGSNDQIDDVLLMGIRM